MQLSISHAGDSIAVAVLDHWRSRLGIDVMSCLAMPRSTSQFWLCERELEACDGNQYACQFVWSLKEALYKAGAHGTRVAFSPRSIDTTAWISKTLLHDLTAKVRSATPCFSAIKDGGALRVLRRGDELVTLIVLEGRAAVPHMPTPRQNQFPKKNGMCDVDNLFPNARCSEAVSR
jgi:4'-phosphopantetheinyl transferase EntD